MCVNCSFSDLHPEYGEIFTRNPLNGILLMLQKCAAWSLTFVQSMHVSKIKAKFCVYDSRIDYKCKIKFKSNCKTSEHAFVVLLPAEVDLSISTACIQ